MTLDKRIMVLLPKDHYQKLKQACELRGESASCFGRRAVLAEMRRMKLLPTIEKALLEA